ncbi:adenine methyltransferase [Lactococcus petauri]|uniref:adenine methyltransferase n=1 Tax=Lactococcus petauri TaxID=1940789 RepID=UPI00254A8929|nr:adenine methyltransferase [Lactococcus petauri]
MLLIDNKKLDEVNAMTYNFSAQHSTAQHSTAQHSTAQHSTAGGNFPSSSCRSSLF